ncbi:MAG: pyruvate/2-oxoglutarate dehydrogenase complex dihydrolipoamide dehydrogenase (E3) component [Gammaproteobacteria bacterium]|jgi:pyruvate/2-oxoglutarate dehydrogenase complex dihydrolipoamide dehydrogenase (E3) component/uncharacterized membrane protein YdjX (TVP38/TMEM64 family)
MKNKKILVAAIVLALIASYVTFDLGQYFSLDFLKARQADLDALYTSHPLRTALIFFAVYVAVTGLSLPGAAVMTLVAGAIFGLWWGIVIVSFASSIGATLAFLAARFVLRDSVQSRFGDKLRAINQGVEKDGAFYLFALRLVPAFPFFIINLVMGLTPIPTLVFYVVSQVGMLAGTLVYVNAGTQLAAIDSLSDIVSVPLLASFALLGLFPIIARKVIEIINAKKAYKGWTRPEKFERDMVVIGGGAAGLVSSYIAAAVKSKVTLIEKHKMGGDCLNYGCVPSKALIRTAKLLSHMKRAREFGIDSATATFDFADVMERVQRVVATIEPHDSMERYESLGVECLSGDAKITSPWTVQVDGKTLSTRSIVIAAGAEPFVPPIEGLDDVGYYTSDTVWGLRELPSRLVVLGGGPIGTELTQCFARLGAQVTQVEMAPRIMIREDEEISQMVTERLRAEGVKVLLEHKAKSFRREGDRKILVAEHTDGDVEIEFDALLVAVGRTPRTRGYGLEELGIPTTATRTVQVNEFLQTRFPNIFACGDVAGPYQFTHTAAHQAWFASVNALFGSFRKFKVDYSVIPWATFTDPEVARVGLNEQDAKEQGVNYEVTTYGIDDLDRAIADEEAHGVVKVLTAPGRDRILGVTIVGDHAGDLLAEYVLAMKHGLGLNKILGTIHTYPTLAEANKYVAGEWKRAHAPQRLLAWVERLHAWRRGDSGFPFFP